MIEVHGRANNASCRFAFKPVILVCLSQMNAESAMERGAANGHSQALCSGASLPMVMQRRQSEAGRRAHPCPIAERIFWCCGRRGWRWVSTTALVRLCVASGQLGTGQFRLVMLTSQPNGNRLTGREVLATATTVSGQPLEGVCRRRNQIRISETAVSH